jgi:SAM-dependent methyltransferase
VPTPAAPALDAHDWRDTEDDVVRNVMAKVRRFLERASFLRLAKQDHIFLYAGDVPPSANYRKFIGLSLRKSDAQHIKHDVLKALPLMDNCVDVYQAEDVFEHILPTELPAVINDIYRVLKPGGIFRLSVPDYRCDVLRERSHKDEHGNPLFDPGGGGAYVNGKVVGGHVWFPVYESVRAIIQQTRFSDVVFYHYYDESGAPIARPIDYSIGYVQRTPDNDARVQSPYRPLSIVLDCRKPDAYQPRKSDAREWWARLTRACSRLAHRLRR